MTKITNKEIVLKHLKQYGSITSWEAIKEYGITRLGAVIFELRKEHNIESKTVKGTDRYNRKISWAKYELKKKKWFRKGEK